EADPSARRADGEAGREALGRATRVAGGERGDAERLALAVEEDGILHDLPREELLGEAGDEDHVEGETAGGLRGGDQHRAVAAARRRHGQLAEPGAEDELHLV